MNSYRIDQLEEVFNKACERYKVTVEPMYLADIDGDKSRISRTNNVLGRMNRNIAQIFETLTEE